MIRITLTNCEVVTWDKNDYSDYMYDGRFFIVIRNGKWIGFYNLEHLISIVINDAEVA